MVLIAPPGKRVVDLQQAPARTQPYFQDLSTAEIAEAMRTSLDWEELMASEMVPALALGAERRLRR